MEKKVAKTELNFFEKFAVAVSKATGSNYAFVISFGIVLTWASLGPIFNYSETWQMVINTLTTIITFLMVFLIQKAQNKDSLAIQLKLNELVAAHEFASNRLVDVENMSEKDLKSIQDYYNKLSALTEKEQSLQVSHSIDEAEENNLLKMKNNKAAKPKKK